MKYSLLRTIHLMSGLVALPFLLMYGISAVQMAHSKWFNLKPSVTVSAPTNLEVGLSPSDVAQRLQLRGDIRGKLPAFRVLRPGVVYEVTYDAVNGKAGVSTSRATPLRMLNRLHHAAGLWPGFLPLKVWGTAIGFVSFATVLLALTGLLMWWQRSQERKPGVALIAVNLAFATVVLILIRTAGP